MTGKSQLFVLFTMDCAPSVTRWSQEGPRDWTLSARSIEGFCDLLLAAGFPPTLFVASNAVEEHAPLLEELAGRGVDVGLQIHPPNMLDGRFKRMLGQYDEADQHSLIEYASELFQSQLDFWPRSVRTGRYSGSDATYQVLYQLGFRQGSLSLPGLRVPRDGVDWTGASQDAHYVDRSNRLQPGSLPFLEVPVTSDPQQHYQPGHPHELCIEMSPFDEWHRPLIDAQLDRMAAGAVPFRALCLTTTSAIAYHERSDKHRATLGKLIDYFETLRDRYDVMPATLAGAHEQFRRQAG